MAEDRTKYLRFSAYSMKELITRKLSEDTGFTDQVYEGSNLAVLIDIVSYMYQCLIYQLNSAAAEAMFSDTQLYENINRLCKFIGYNPKGFSPSVVALKSNSTATTSSSDDKLELQKYSAIDTGKTDAAGRKVFYSTSQSYGTDDLVNGAENTVICYNGLWKLYSTVFTSSGEDYQTFMLDGIQSDASKQKYVSEKMIHVYVQEADGNFEQWNATSDGLFMDSDIDNGAYVHTNTEQIYNVRLNEDKRYELTFGNNSLGKIPPAGSLIYVMYLDSNDESVQLEPLDIEGKQFMHNMSLFGMTSDVYKCMFGLNNGANQQSSGEQPSNVEDCDAKGGAYSFKWTNVEKSSAGKLEETVDEIRRNAPVWFKTGNRLVTASDYEYYIQNRFKSDVTDVQCQNNSEYISTLYRWLYNIGIKRWGRGDYYLTPNRIMKADLHYADAADANNVYIWIKMKDDAEIYKELINTEIASVKMLTHEPVYLAPIIVNFAPCAQDADSARLMHFQHEDQLFDENGWSYFEITVENNTLYANSNIQQRVANVIQQFFNEDNLKIGQMVNNNDLLDKIYALGSISNVRTVYLNTSTGDKRIIPGLAFATWSASCIDLGDDLEVSSSSVCLEPFQFPRLYNSGAIVSHIKVIRRAINDVNTVQY